MRLIYAISLLWLCVLFASGANAQPAACNGGVGGTSTQTVEYSFAGPSNFIDAITEEIVGPQTVVTPASGLCTASCSIGPQGTCAANVLPTMTNCSIASSTCSLGAGNTILRTSGFIQFVPLSAREVPLLQWLPLLIGALLLVASLWPRKGTGA